MSGLNKVQLIALYADGLSIPDIARQTGLGRSTVRYHLVSGGVRLRDRVTAARLSGKLGQHIRGKKLPPHTAERRQRISEGRLRWGDENAAGVSLKPSGYREITRGPNKGRHEHVVIMEERIGRRLLSDECVHHIDGNKINNNINNLALMTTSAHARLHRREEQIAKKGQQNVGS